MIRTGTLPRRAALIRSEPRLGGQDWYLQQLLLCPSSQDCLPCHSKTSTSCALQRRIKPTVSELTRSARNLSMCASPHTTLHVFSQHSAPM